MLEPALGSASEEIIVTEGQRLIEKGRAEGRAEGRTEGRAEGVRAALLRIIARRGFRLPERRRRLVARESDLSRLERWLEAAVTAERVGDIFEDS